MATREAKVSDYAALIHLLKAALGTGILAMPVAFHGSGLVLGIFGTIAVSVVCTHCTYILATSAYRMRMITGKEEITFSEVAEEACLNGPPWAQKFATTARIIILVGLFISYFMLASCYCVIMSENFNYVVNYHLGYTIEIRITIAIMLVPLILLVYVPNLKYLVPFSMVANIFMAIGLLITMYYIVVDLPPISERYLITADITRLPVFLGITIFAMQVIGVIMPLVNSMETPEHFTGLFGVLNQGMCGVTIIYIIMGFMGYLKYGPEVHGAVTLNLPIGDYAPQAVNILIGASIFFTFGLQFYVCLEIGWNAVKDRYQNNPLVANYILRTVMTILCVLLSIAVPKIVPFVGLIGAFCFSLLGLIAPILIEIIAFWDDGFGKFYWKIVKDVFVIVTAIAAIIFGSKSAIEHIIEMYKGDNKARNDTKS
ncbi:proton-coupled amino acid transporter-like protein pathetic isoform X1 [Leptinotarsa decemlineata]|uniref:proton-coupled amino acid transporter-like protein pathetic isoform X1 n=2 Tax=Leptinotarsa decemlineata TaxID=7539 RepID=UPI003D307669